MELLHVLVDLHPQPGGGGLVEEGLADGGLVVEAGAAVSPSRLSVL